MRVTQPPGEAADDGGNTVVSACEASGSQMDHRIEKIRIIAHCLLISFPAHVGKIACMSDDFNRLSAKLVQLSS
ncbi:MAG: hypothetical protein QOH16_1881 [Gaiellaceae bacterium]|nr:hypothetical protein [Gaiellaceae bacterium]